MSVESIIKKRGRPKKAVDKDVPNELIATVDEQESKKGKRRTRITEPISTGENATPKKRIPKKTTSTETPVLNVENEQSSTDAGILGRANAFVNIRNSVNAFSNGIGLSQEQLLQLAENSEATAEVRSTKLAGLRPNRSATGVDEVKASEESAALIQRKTSPASSSSEPPQAGESDSHQKRSKFLASFLVETTTSDTPVARQGSKFPDRSAMKPEIPSIEDIVQGPGVSGFTTPSVSFKESATRSRTSFKPLTIAKFPHPLQRSGSVQIPPQNYTVAQFSSFKQNPSVQLPEATQTAISNPPRPSLKNAKLPVHPSGPRKPEPESRPPRPTEMPYEELRKQPRYQQLQKKYMGFMVGIPVVLVTSYVLWKRFVQDQTKRRRQRGDVSSTMGIDRANANVTSNGGV